MQQTLWLSHFTEATELLTSLTHAIKIQSKACLTGTLVPNMRPKGDGKVIEIFVL